MNQSFFGRIIQEMEDFLESKSDERLFRIYWMGIMRKRVVFFKMGRSRPLLLYFCLFYLFTMGRKNFADVGTQTADHRCWKWPLYQLSHHHYLANTSLSCQRESQPKLDEALGKTHCSCSTSGEWGLFFLEGPVFPLLLWPTFCSFL